MTGTIRVPTAVFKSNMRPFVDEARAGKSVIVTNDGVDDFKVLPVIHNGPPPVSANPIPAEIYQRINVDEPAFSPL